MAFKMKGNPMKLGKIQGTSGHAKAIKVATATPGESPNKILGIKKKYDKTKKGLEKLYKFITGGGDDAAKKVTSKKKSSGNKKSSGKKDDKKKTNGKKDKPKVTNKNKEKTEIQIDNTKTEKTKYDKLSKKDKAEFNKLAEEVKNLDKNSKEYVTKQNRINEIMGVKTRRTYTPPKTKKKTTQQQFDDLNKKIDELISGQTPRQIGKTGYDQYNQPFSGANYKEALINHFRRNRGKYGLAAGTIVTGVIGNKIISDFEKQSNKRIKSMNEALKLLNIENNKTNTSNTGTNTEQFKIDNPQQTGVKTYTDEEFEKLK